MVILEFAKWIMSECDRTESVSEAAPVMQLSVFLKKAANKQVHPTPLPLTPTEKDALSRMTTTTTTCTDQVAGVNAGVGSLGLTERVQSFMGSVSKEELRTAMMACLLLSSKWNNSRYLPPDVVGQ